MRAEHRLLVLSVTLAGAIAGAIAGAMSQLGGFVDSQAQTGRATAVAHNVAGATSVGVAMYVDK